LLSLTISYSTGSSTKTDTVTISLNGRKMLSKKKYENVSFSMKFKGVKELYYYDTFDRQQISQSTLTKTSSGEFYLSLDPFNEGEPSQEDNMIIRSQQLFFIDPNDKENEIL
jgi:hypothetical protein